MPITLAKLKKAKTVIEVNYQGDTAKVTYRPNSVTPAMWRRVISGGNNQEFLVASIAELVEDWDVLTSDGGPKIKPDSDEAASLPTDFLNEVMNAILEDMRAGTEAKKD